MSNSKDYLGDGVYIDTDGYGLILTTEDGVGVSNEIYLEPSVYESLVLYVAHLTAKNKELKVVD